MTKYSIAVATAAAAFCIATPTSAKQPSRVAVLTGKMAQQVLHQCSRSTPSAGVPLFTPKRSHVEALDRAVASSRDRRLPKDARTVADLRRSYAIEVVGISRSGRRFVYGNYYPLVLQEGMKEAPTTPTIVCDGGASFFGAEIDAATGHLTHLAFNGAQ